MPTQQNDMNDSRGNQIVVDLEREYKNSAIQEVLDELDRDLVGLRTVKTRIQEIASLLLVERVRNKLGLTSTPPALHMCFIGNPGTGKTTIAVRMADILHRLEFIETPNLVSVTRDDLVGEEIGQTAPKTKAIINSAKGGVLFIDEAYYLYRPEDELDYGRDAIEILIQLMENERADVVIILAGYKPGMDKFFKSNPGMHSRIGHHIVFPDYGPEELMGIALKFLHDINYDFTPAGKKAFAEFLEISKNMEHFANARTVRNAIDRMRLRHANRLFLHRNEHITKDDLRLLDAADILPENAFKEGVIEFDDEPPEL
jgi:probable Rubsico expression protein CbbX